MPLGGRGKASDVARMANFPGQAGDEPITSPGHAVNDDSVMNRRYFQAFRLLPAFDPTRSKRHEFSPVVDLLGETGS